jgi:hypothetical protein
VQLRPPLDEGAAAAFSLAYLKRTLTKSRAYITLAQLVGNGRVAGSLALDSAPIGAAGQGLGRVDGKKEMVT